MHARCILWAALLALIGPTATVCCSHGTKKCGTGCTPPLGYCVEGKCYDRKVKQVTCQPDYEQCSGVACRLDEFCSNGKVCRPNTCKERQQYACPADTSPLRLLRVTAFNCSIGTGAAQTSCTLQPQESSSAKLAAMLPGSKALLILLSAALAAAVAAAV
ncbi:hypothetical protein COO60DRAFT_1481387 [Scenedesmus sp. NREL 46B-D3]|nr:hypothetical protein COO60DRAFT_1481387 [Scenedesmus sp. NREL 46B-D3]